MKIANGKIAADYHPQIVVNARAFLDRVPVTGASEAKELARCAEVLEAIISGRFEVLESKSTEVPSSAP